MIGFLRVNLFSVGVQMFLVHFQVQGSRAEPMTSVTLSVTSCSVGLQSSACVEEKTVSKQHTEAQRITGNSADLYNSQGTNLTLGGNNHTHSSNKSDHNPVQSLEVKGEGYIASSQSENTHLIRGNSEDSTWTPIKDHDPTLASVIVDNSPECLVSFNESESSEKSLSDREPLPANSLTANISLPNGEKVTDFAENLNLVSSSTFGTKSVATTESELTIWHSKSDTEFCADSAVSTKLNTTKTVEVSSVQANTIPTVEKSLVCRPYIKKKYGSIGGKRDIPQLKLGSLKPETIQAIKRGNPALFQKQFKSLNNSDQLDISDKSMSSKNTVESDMREDSSMIEHETSAQNKENREDENTRTHDVNNKNDMEQADKSTGKSAKRYILQEQLETLSGNSNEAATHYPLNMTKRVSDGEVEEVGKPKTWFVLLAHLS